jgi:membrane fusion protein, multidrug efflux system
MKGAWSAGRLIGIALLVGFLGVVVWRVVEGTRAGAPAPTVEELREERGVPVVVAEASSGLLEIWRRHDGTVAGVREAVVRARIEDEVVAVPVSVGDRVRAGQVLVRQRGAAVDATVRRSEVQLRQARSALERVRKLHEAGAASAQELEAAEAQRDLARATVEAARGERELVSPLAGVVTELPARPGMIPTAGDPLVRVADLSQLVVRLQVPAAEAARTRPGQPARLLDDDAVGEVRRVSLGADPVSRLVEVEVEFPPAARLVAGTLVAVEIRTAAREDAVQVPRDAVRDGVVWVADEEGRAERREVDVGLEGAERVEIARGVKPGEQVVVEGASLLREGARLRVVNGSERAN